MRRFFLTILPLLMALPILTGCDIHQWPELHDQPVPPGPDTPEPEPPIPTTTIPVSLEYALDFYLWEHRYDPVLGKIEEADPTLSLYPDYPGTSYKYTGMVPAGQIQVYAKVFPSSAPSQCVVEQSFVREINGSYDTDFELEFPESGTYDVIVWSQLLERAEAAPFYDPSDFSRVRIVPANYAGSTDYRDGFCGRIRIDADTEVNGRYVVRMARPMGKFELVTTDLSEFLDRETVARRLPTRASAADYRVRISFPMYYPSSYSAIDDRLENATTGVAFETRMTVTGESEASLGFDYVMLNNIAESGVQAQVDVYRLDGTHVAGSSMLTIPMRRDNHTLLRGAFLTMEGNGGVGIDPGFNGDHNITWH